MSALFGPGPLHPDFRFPHLAAVFQAVPGFALAVAQGIMSFAEAEALLRGCKPVMDQAPFAPGYDGAAAQPGRPGQSDLSFALRVAVDAAESRRFRAEIAVQKALAPLLDQRAGQGAVRQAARGANAEGALLRREVDWIIATEQAWWVRLHVALDGEAPLAA